MSVICTLVKMVYTVFFRLCRKEDVFNIFQNLKVHLTGDYVALKLIKGKLCLLKVFVKDMSIEESFGFKSFQVSSLDLLEQGYRGYLEIERRGSFFTSQYLDIESSLKELQKFLNEKKVDLMDFQDTIHVCGYPGQAKAIEIKGCSKAMKTYYFAPMKKSMVTQVIEENNLPTSKSLGLGAQCLWVNGAEERSERLMPFYLGAHCEDLAKSSRQLIKAKQVIFIFVQQLSGYFPSVTLEKETPVGKKPLHPLAWQKVFHSEDAASFLNKIVDPLPEKSLRMMMMNSISPKTLFEELDEILTDVQMPDNEAENLLESLLAMTEGSEGLDKELSGVENVLEDMNSFQMMCTVCYQLSNEGCHCHEMRCERCFGL